MIKDTPFIIVDLETTGLEPRLDEIIEVAGVKMVNGEIVDEWTQLLNPGIFIPQVTTDITGITTDMLKGMPHFNDIAEEFLKFMGEDSIFVAHNADFDRSFVNYHLKSASYDELLHPYLCTFKLAKRVHPNLAQYGLGALTETFQIPLPRAHRALDDATATAHLLNKFLGTLQDGGLRYIKDIPTISNLPQEVKEQSAGQVSLF